MNPDEASGTNEYLSKWRWRWFYWRWWYEGFAIWLGQRLPAEIVYRASNQLLEWGDENGHDVYGTVELQNAYMAENGSKGWWE